MTLSVPSAALPSSLLLVLACASASGGNAPNVAADPRAAAPVAAQERAPHGAMLRYPDISADRIVFSYADDLWIVDDDGGVAEPLASPAGLERDPRFSPDGSSIAFMANYDGNSDLYTVPVDGGPPFRVTHHPGAEVLTDWTATGELLYHVNGTLGSARQSQLLLVSPRGGLPRALPVPYGSWGALDAGSTRLVYSPISRVGRTWKRYRGGMASDLWLYELGSGAATRLTDFEGTDVQPMWRGESIYYLSDAGAKHRMNVWVMGADGSGKRQVTDYDDDVQWPAIGGDRMVYVVGDTLRVLDLASERDRVVDVRVPGAKPKLRPQTVDAAEFVTGYSVSPSAKRLAVVARGDVWTVPAKHGTPRNLTHTSGAFERDATWSPDGRWIAYFSDASGEYELYVVQSDGKEPARRVTHDGAPFRYALEWSPDSTRLSYVTKSGRLELVDIESGEVTRVAEGPFVQYQANFDVSWSHDGAWLAYVNSTADSMLSGSIHLYEVATGTDTQVTADYFVQSDPCFDRAGDYLYYVSSGNFAPTYSDVDTTWIYEDAAVLHVVPLRADMASPFAKESDEEAWDDETGAAAEDDAAASDDAAAAEGEVADHDEDEAEEAEAPLRIDLDGFERRAIRLPVAPGSFGSLAVNDAGALLYVRRGDEPEVKLFDVSADEPEEKTVLAGVRGFGLSADGKHMLYTKDGKPQLADAKEGAQGEAVSTAGMQVVIEPREEWAQILREAWRLQRDFFYVENMHGVDWEGVYRRYAAMLEDATSRRDVAFLIGELIAELNVGHAYSYGGDFEDEPQANTGMLGVDFALDQGAYRLARIYEGAPWDSDARGPLSQPGVDVHKGDWLLAVNGVPLDPAVDPWAEFAGLAGKTITLTVSAKPVLDDDAREVVVEALASDRDLRYRAWIEANRRYVEERSGGRVGYVYVPSTGIDGQNDLVRQYFPQLGKQALIVDDRWNAGGQIPSRFVELLDRPVMNYWARRHGQDWSWPHDGHQGPKCMLINGAAGSGGDLFPAYFRQKGLGPLVGTRTWGGLVGLSGNPGLIDGAYVSVPTFGFYEKDGTWGIEGHGVDPDVEVIADPGRMHDGADPQLDTAVDLMLRAIEEHGYHRPPRPAAPDRSGMGIRPEDH